jgi:acetyl esterase
MGIQPEKSTRKLLSKIVITISFLIISIFLAHKLTPWPSALLIRYVFERGAEQANQKLEKHVPKGISEILDMQYDPKDHDAKLDVYYPHGIEKKLAVIVWVHGGGWISGDKLQSSNYLKILSSKGYIVVSVDYSIAPEKKYPIPVKQVMTALKFLQDNSNKLHIDSNSMFLAGDSAGSHIVAQVANSISDPNYAKLINIPASIERAKIKGLILYCGAYAVDNINLDGDFGSFLKTVLWSYSGKKDFMNDSYFKTASIIDHIGPKFPPCFISAGNGDPLLVHSKDLVKKLNALHIETDTLFFPKNFTPELPHEYQFDLDIEPGRMALSRSLEFLKKNK